MPDAELEVIARQLLAGLATPGHRGCLPPADVAATAAVLLGVYDRGFGDGRTHERGLLLADVCSPPAGGWPAGTPPAGGGTLLSPPNGERA